MHVCILEYIAIVESNDWFVKFAQKRFIEVIRIFILYSILIISMSWT